MKNFSATPYEMIASFWRNRSLIYVLSRREVLGRYRGSYLGIIWSFFSPLLMLIVYVFVFSEILKSRWNPQSDSKTEFALILFAGLLIFNIFSECLTQAPRLILSNVNYVKKVVFPLEVLPWVVLFSALFHGSISLLVWTVAYFIFFGAPYLTLFYLPLIVLPICFMVMGLSWILASLGVFFRDISQFIGVGLTATMFLSPIFYPITSLPDHYQDLIMVNPLSVPVELTRNFLFWGIGPFTGLYQLIVYSFTSFLVAFLGFYWFQKTRRGFADVL
jgi:lipopolysaccharide transport system permease protein